MTLLAKLLVFVAGAYVSFAHCAEYWVVGPVFGFVVLCWQAASLRTFLAPKRLGFLASSTLILPDAVQKWVNAVSLWQAAYVFCFFGPELRHKG